MMNKKTPHEIDVLVGSRIRMRRMLCGISQEKLGQKLGLTFQQVQKYEKGVNRVGASRLYQIAQALEVDVDYFFDDLPAAKNDAATTQAIQLLEAVGSQQGMALSKAFCSISDPMVRHSIVALIRSIAAKDARP
jgi:transcriptional regulator with XRE-family HTH domain